jgi:hypothetical protein
MKKYSVFCLSILLLSSGSCKKEECFTPPEPFVFKIVNTAGDNITSTSSADLKIYYLVGQSKVYLASQADFFPGSAEAYIRVPDLPWISEDATKSKTFFLERIDRPVPDVLFVDVVREEGGKCTRYTYKSVKFNNVSSELQKSSNPYAYVLKQL